MTRLPLSEHGQASESARSSGLWLVKIIGLSLGIAVAMVAMGVIAITALATPSLHSTTAAANALSAQPANGGSMSSTAALTDTTASADSPLPTATPLSTNAPAPTATPTLMETLLPTTTSTPTPTPTPSPAATQHLVVRSSSSSQRASAATKTPTAPPEPLSFSFYYRAYCHKYDDNLQVIDLYITGHGGQPPYDYYNDTTQFGTHTNGMERLTVKTSSGNPVPFKIIIVDSRGQSYMENFFLKTKVHCVTR